MPKVVVIGAGIVGTSLADELTASGLHRRHCRRPRSVVHHRRIDIARTRLGLPDNPSKTMTAFARYTVEKFSSLSHPDGWAFNAVGGLEVATTEERWADLHRKAGWAAAWGIDGRLLTAAECAALHPLLDRDRILGGFHTPSDGLAKAVRAGEAQARQAISRGAMFRPNTEVLGIVEKGGRVTGVQTTRRRDRCRHRGVRRRLLGCPVRQAGRARRPVGANGAPVRAHRADRCACRAQQRAAGSGPADPAPSGPGPVLPRACGPHGHRFLWPQADARRYVHAII